MSETTYGNRAFTDGTSMNREELDLIDEIVEESIQTCDIILEKGEKK